MFGKIRLDYVRFVFIGLLATLLGGCATIGRSPPPVTVPEVIRMSQNGVPDRVIIDRMRAAGTVYRLKASQLVRLRRDGVSNRVLNYMQNTYLNAVRERQSLRDWNNWNQVGGWWYGGWPAGWRGDWDGDWDGGWRHHDWDDRR